MSTPEDVYKQEPVYTENRSLPVARSVPAALIPLLLLRQRGCAAKLATSKGTRATQRAFVLALTHRWPTAGLRATVTRRVFIRRWAGPQRVPRTDRSDRSDPQAKKLVLLWGKHPLGGGLATENGPIGGTASLVGLNME